MVAPPVRACALPSIYSTRRAPDARRVVTTPRYPSAAAPPSTTSRPHLSIAPTRPKKPPHTPAHRLTRQSLRLESPRAALALPLVNVGPHPRCQQHDRATMDMGIDITRRNKKPRPLSEPEKDKLDEFVESIHYSARCVRFPLPAAPAVAASPRISPASKRRRVLTGASCRYSDSEYEYRHVQLPKQMLKVIPKEYFDGSRGTLKLLWEEEWRALGITQVRLSRAHWTSPHKG